MLTKKWYQSKTLWANVAAVLAYEVQYLTGQHVVSADDAVIILGVINLILRKLTYAKLVK